MVSHVFWIISHVLPCFADFSRDVPGLSHRFGGIKGVLRELLAAQQPKDAGRRGAAQELGDAPEPAPVDLLGPRDFG